MERDTWYKHRTLDHIERVSEYVEIMLDGAMDTDLSDDAIQKIYSALIMLQGDISRQLRS